MSKETKTDNHFLGAKLALRRKFLSTYHADKPFSVVDCFSGGEAIWTPLRAEFPVAEYLALDVKEKRGRLKIDSLRYLQNQKWNHDVVDLDAYGSPWRHWYEVLKRGRDCTVFLTIGQVKFNGFTGIQKEALTATGITFKIPNGLNGQLLGIVLGHNLGAACVGYNIPLALEALNDGGNAKYIGVRLEKKPPTLPNPNK